jgi:hypothetical protein
MEEALKRAVIAAHWDLPDACRRRPADEDQLRTFEQEFGAIPQEFRWYLKACGGGVCGSNWVDGIEQLMESHRKFRKESGPEGWTMQGVFVIGWDGGGNPFGIKSSTDEILVEDHDFGGIHEMAKSFSDFLVDGLLR